MLALPLFGPERARKRMIAAAVERLPESDGLVALAGVAAETAELLSAPYSKRTCVAYWARRVTPDPEDDSKDAALGAELVFDRERAEVVDGAGSDRREEIVLRPGQRVVVRGLLVRGGDAPFRAATKLVADGDRRVTIAIVDGAKPAHIEIVQRFLGLVTVSACSMPSAKYAPCDGATTCIDAAVHDVLDGHVAPDACDCPDAPTPPPPDARPPDAAMPDAAMPDAKDDHDDHDDDHDHGGHGGHHH